MLILSRKLNESIVIDGRIIVKVLRIDKDTVKLGIQAPAELPVHREEIHDVIQRNKQAALGIGQTPPPKSSAQTNSELEKPPLPAPKSDQEK
jgi:carbon storage regulator